MGASGTITKRTSSQGTSKRLQFAPGSTTDELTTARARSLPSRHRCFRRGFVAKLHDPIIAERNPPEAIPVASRAETRRADVRRSHPSEGLRPSSSGRARQPASDARHFVVAERDGCLLRNRVAARGSHQSSISRRPAIVSPSPDEVSKSAVHPAESNRRIELGASTLHANAPYGCQSPRGRQMERARCRSLDVVRRGSLEPEGSYRFELEPRGGQFRVERNRRPWRAVP
jgi:hypothetical protein